VLFFSKLFRDFFTLGIILSCALAGLGPEIEGHLCSAFHNKHIPSERSVLALGYFHELFADGSEFFFFAELDIGIAPAYEFLLFGLKPGLLGSIREIREETDNSVSVVVERPLVTVHQGLVFLAYPRPPLALRFVHPINARIVLDRHQEIVEEIVRAVSLEWHRIAELDLLLDRRFKLRRHGRLDGHFRDGIELRFLLLGSGQAGEHKKDRKKTGRQKDCCFLFHPSLLFLCEQGK